LIDKVWFNGTGVFKKINDFFQIRNRIDSTDKPPPPELLGKKFNNLTKIANYANLYYRFGAPKKQGLMPQKLLNSSYSRIPTPKKSNPATPVYLPLYIFY